MLQSAAVYTEIDARLIIGCCDNSVCYSINNPLKQGLFN
jgi:hypothetical protein